MGLFENGTAGSKLARHILSKLPNARTKELAHKVGSDFPLIADQSDHYDDIIKTLVRTSYKRENNNSEKSRGTKTEPR